MNLKMKGCRGTLGQGIRFGLLMAFLQAPLMSLIWYSVLPIPASLAVSWLIGGVLMQTALGVVVGFVYRP